MRIKCPDEKSAAIEWTLKVVLGEFLGLAFEIELHAGEDVVLMWEGRRLTLVTPFFQQARANWLKPSSLPKEPVSYWNPKSAGLGVPECEPVPILYGHGGFTIDPNGNGRLEVDVLGAMFFMLSRYEERVAPVADHHDRFPGCAALAHRAGFLTRPIVDEHVEVLWAALHRIWPHLERRTSAGQMSVSCDVDEPYERWIRGPLLFATGITGALLRRRSWRFASNRVRNFFASKRGCYSFDPNWTFDWYMTVCEQAVRRVTFYFLTTPGKTRQDCIYRLDEPRMQALLRNIDDRGHEIGLHGSYKTFRDRNLVALERQLLLDACRKAGTRANIRGNRQHFLRWRVEETPDHLDAAGFDYDTSGGYADRPGFRFGTARSFPMWSWLREAPLRLRQRPLIVMESSIISHLGLGYTPEARNLMLGLKERAMRTGGEFSLLWHNSHLESQADRELFVRVL